VVKCVLVHSTFETLAELCQVTPSESLTEDTLMDDPERYVTIQSTTTSFGFVVEAVIVKDEPADQVPVVLPSRPMVPGLELGSVVWVSTVRQGEEHPVTGGTWFS